MFRKLSAAVIVAIFILILPIQSYATEINVKINGTNVVFTQTSGTPFIDSSNRTQVPFRQTMEQFGCTISWDQVNKIAIAEMNGIVVRVPIGEKLIYKNNVQISNDTAALIKDNKTYLPIKVVLEAFGANVKWDSASHTVIVTSNSIIDTNSTLYKFDASTGTIMEYLGSTYAEDDYTIPEKINGITVSGVGKGSYFDTKMKTLRIPNTITVIDTTDTDMKTFGFMLDNIIVNSNNQYFSDIDGVLFNKDKTELLWYGEHRTPINYDVPQGTVTIKKNAFLRNDDLQIINIPSSVQTIENDAFNNCIGLQKINVSSGNKAYYSLDGILYKINGNPVQLSACWKYPSVQATDTTRVDQTTITKGDIDSFEKYINATYKSMDTPIGTMTMSHSIDKNTVSMFPYDYRIHTDWHDVSPFDIKYSIEYTDSQKEKTIEILKDIQKNIYNDAIECMPNKKFTGGYYTSYYKYPYCS